MEEKLVEILRNELARNQRNKQPSLFSEISIQHPQLGSITIDSFELIALAKELILQVITPINQSDLKGDGSKENPFIIDSLNEIFKFAKFLQFEEKKIINIKMGQILLEVSKFNKYVSYIGA